MIGRLAAEMQDAEPPHWMSLSVLASSHERSFPPMDSASNMAPAVQGPCMGAGGAHPVADEVGVLGLVTPSSDAYGPGVQGLEVSA